MFKNTIIPKIILLILIPCAFLSLFYCKRNPFLGTGKTVVEGRVTDIITGYGLSETPVTILYKTHDGIGIYYLPLKEVFSDKNGNYELEFDAEVDKEYFVMAFHELYDESGTRQGVAGGKRNKNIDLKLAPYGWVLVKFINEPPLDTVSFSINGFLDRPGSVTGISKDSSQLGKIIGGTGYELIIFKRLKQGESFRQIDTVFCPPHDTITHIVKY